MENAAANVSELAATMRDALAKLVGQCDRKLKRAACPIIEILETDTPVDPSANRSIHRDDPSRKTRELEAS